MTADSKKIVYGVAGLVILTGIFIFLGARPKKTTENLPDNSTAAQYQASSSFISVISPLANSSILSPVTITGRAKGSWFFEASFPITILDSNGTVLGKGIAKAQGDWMTTDFVDFTASINYTKPLTSTGYILLHNDNPSGLPQNNQELRVPINFSSVTSSKPPGTCAPNSLSC